MNLSGQSVVGAPKLNVYNYDVCEYGLEWSDSKGVSYYEIEYYLSDKTSDKISNKASNKKRSYIKIKSDKCSTFIKVKKKNALYSLRVRCVYIINGQKICSKWSNRIVINSSKTWHIIKNLKEKYPNKMYWNHNGVTNSPCNHTSFGYIYCNTYKGITNNVFKKPKKGMQCLGFASLCSDKIFGKNTGAYIFYEFDDVRVGDQVRTNNETHSMLVIKKKANRIVVAEVNRDYNSCMIEWGRSVTKEELEKTNSFYIRRSNFKE